METSPLTTPYTLPAQTVKIKYMSNALEHVLNKRATCTVYDFDSKVYGPEKNRT